MFLKDVKRKKIVREIISFTRELICSMLCRLILRPNGVWKKGGCQLSVLTILTRECLGIVK